jgi:NDP-sugar pyrophosphorylase family protein
MCKRAIILAGGKGTRLRPYTIALPKPLVPIGEKPILEIIITQLISNGFEHITITINHLADIIKAFFGDGSKWGIKIDYSLEEKPLSTMGPLSLLTDLPENFLIMNGDVLSDVDFGELYDFHISKKSIFTISSYVREQKTDYGVLEIDSNDNLSGFKEKPVERYNVSMGIYVANRKILNYIPYNTFYGFDSLMLDLIKNNNLPFIKHRSSR